MTVAAPKTGVSTSSTPWLAKNERMSAKTSARSRNASTVAVARQSSLDPTIVNSIPNSKFQIPNCRPLAQGLPLGGWGNLQSAICNLQFFGPDSGSADPYALET